MATYFVDTNAAAGGDGTQAAPYDALSDLPTLVSGDTVYLANGSYFREQIHYPLVSNLTIRNYGAAGSAPVLDAADILVNANFTKTGGRTNVYEITVSQDTSDGYQSAWEDAARMKYVTSVANCDAEAGTFYIASGAGASKTLYIHPSGSTNPISDGKEYEASIRDHGIHVGDNCTIFGVFCRRGVGADGSLVMGANATLNMSVASEGVKHSGFVSSGTVTDCIAWGCRPDGRTNATEWVWYDTDASGDSITITRTHAIATPVAGETSLITCFYNHAGSVGDEHNEVEYVDCIASGGSVGFSGGPRVASGNALKLTRTHAINCDSDTSPIGKLIATDHWTDSTRTDKLAVFNLQSVTPTTEITIDGWRAYLTDVLTNRGLVYGEGDWAITRSAVHYAGTDLANLLYPQDTTTADMTGVILETSTSNTCRPVFDNLLRITFGTLDYNAYSPTQTWRRNFTNYSGLANWQAAESEDANSLEIDPQLSDPANGDFAVGESTVSALPAGVERFPTYETTPSGSQLTDPQVDAFYPGGGVLDPSVLKYGMILDDSTLKPGLVNETYTSGTGTSDTLKPGVLDSEGNLKPGLLDADGNIKPGALR